MVKNNPFNPIEPNKKNPFNPVTVKEQSSPVYNQQAPLTPAPVVKTQPGVSLGPRVTPAKDSYGLPTSTISQGTEQPAEKPSIWNRVAKTLLPRKAEDFFGLNEPEAKKQVMDAEAAKQYYWAGEKSNLSGFIDSITDWDKEDIPYVGSGIEAVDLVKVATAANRFEKGEQTEKDVALLDKYITNSDKEVKLNKNKGYAIGETVKNSTRFMGELAFVALTELFTGGLAPTGDTYVLAQASKLGAKKTVEKMMKDKVFRNAINTAVKSSIKKETGLLAKQFAFTAPTNITGSAAERMIGTYDLDTGEVIQEGTGIGESTVNAVTQHAVELVTERGGGITGKILGKMTAPLKKIAVKTAIYQALSKALPKASNAQLTAILSKSGWNGTLGEFWEERDADAFNQLLFKMGLGDQEFQGLTLDQVTTELIAFSIMGGGVNAAQRGVQKVIERPQTKPGYSKLSLNDETPPPAEPSQTKELNDILVGEANVTLEKTDLSNLESDSFVRADEGLAKDITERGYAPIIVDKNGFVLDGNNRLNALETIGEKEIDVYRLNKTVKELENISDEKWMKFLEVAQGVAVKNDATVISNNQDLWEGVEPIPRDSQGPGHRKLNDFIDQMQESETIFPEEAPILKALFENTDDDLLNTLNLQEDNRLKRALGSFRIKSSTLTGVKPETNLLKMQKGQTLKTDNSATNTFVHEYGHAGWYLVLNEAERAEVTKIYNSMSKEKQRALFSHNPNAKYYASNPQEFWAQSFADYIMENKISQQQMEPLLKRISKRFFDSLKKLVARGNVKSVELMKPLYEKILAGDYSTPLTEFANQEPPSFKTELQQLINGIAPQTSAIAEGTGQKSLFTPPKTKEVPTETLAPPVGESPSEAAEAMRKEAVQGLPPDIGSTIEPIERVAEGKRETPLNQQPGFIDLFRTPWRVFERMGLSESYQKLLKGYESYMKELPGNIDKITAWSKRVSKESNQRIFQFLDGNKEVELDANETQVANEIKAWLKQWADRLGMAPDARITDYITHIFPAGKGGEIPEEIAYMISKKTPGSVYNPFLLERLGAKGYKEDTWSALDAYVKRATRKVNMDPGLAAVKEASSELTNDKQIAYIDAYLSGVNLRPSIIDKWIDTSIKQIFGYKFGARPTASLTRSIRMMISRAKIGGSITSFAKNLTQSVNTFADLGSKYTTIGYIDLVKYRSKELEDEGVLIAPFIEDRQYSAVKGVVEKVDKVLFINMNASELANRGAAYYGAKAKFLDGKISPKEYKMAFGSEMPKGYTPTDRDARDYGKFVAAKTQFKFGALDTPLAMNSDLMKMVFQFQTFGLKQAEFVAQMVKDKEYAKLARYTVASSMMFEIIGSAFGMGWEDVFKTWRFGLPPGIKFFNDLFKQGVKGEDNYGNKLDTEEKVKAVSKTLFTNVVPGGAQMSRTKEGLDVVNEGASRTRGGTFQYKVDQTPSNYIRGALFGKYNLPGNDEFYKEREDKAKGKSKPGSGGRNPFNPI